MKSEIKKQRRAILARIDSLNARKAAGEDVTKELQDCGNELDALAGTTRKEKGPAKVTRELKTRAQANGISRSTLARRVYEEGWDPEDAATLPVQKKIQRVLTPEDIEKAEERKQAYHSAREERLQWKPVADAHGVKWKTYRSRRTLGWSPEESATTLPFTKGMSEVRLKAYKNGIDKDIFKNRLASGWTEEEAATYPKGTYIKRIRKALEESQ